MNDWAASLARYAAAMSALREPVTAEAIRAVQDALAALRVAHEDALARSMARAARCRT